MKETGWVFLFSSCDCNRPVLVSYNCVLINFTLIDRHDDAGYVGPSHGYENTTKLKALAEEGKN